MRIERTNNEILIRLSAKESTSSIQRLLDLVEFWEITSESRAREKDINDLAAKSKEDWWSKNKNRYTK